MHLVFAALFALAPLETRWAVRTSQGFDALCALNILSGDPYYARQYPRDTAMFGEVRYAAARAAAERLKVRIKDEKGSIISALLTLVFSGGADSTLAAVLESARHPEALERAYRASPFWGESSWKLFVDVRGDVIAALEGMSAAGFEVDWARGFEGEPAQRAASFREQLSAFDVLGEQQRLIGHELQNGQIEVILLRYSRPHGIRIQGGRFLTNIGYPLSIVLRNAAHEPLHPPFDARAPVGIHEAIATLSHDPLLMKIVAEHNPSFGYTSMSGYIEENVVQALEQIVSERLGFAVKAVDRWRTGDDGMHVLAVALYDLMRESRFADAGGRFEDWFTRAVAEGRLRSPEIERRARRVLGDDIVDRWKGPTDARRPIWRKLAG